MPSELILTLNQTHFFFSHSQEEFDDYTNIDKDDFLLKTKKWKSLAKVGITKRDLKRIFNAIDRFAGGFGSINYRDILQYVSLGDKKMMQELHANELDDDDEDIDKGVWGASPIVDVQLSSSDLEEAR